ncbi:hypothetical protein [Halopelagius fulvigenes]|uniref:DUF7847 domain-containing protein n=1 Tax=Halopelagius fulvigenes TaxID=1198324 RepID=A0ABD5TZW1_9EURY
MAAIDALRSALSALGRNPVLFLVGLLYGLIVLPQQALSLTSLSFLSYPLQILTFFVTPFVVAGLLGMASEGLDGETSLSTLTRVGRDRYVPLLVGSIVEFAILLVFGVVATIVGVVAAVGLLGAGGAGGAGGGAMLAVGALVVVLVLALLVLHFFIQFYSVAIVVGEAGALDGFRESYRLVRDNLVSALGYSVINLVVSILTTIPITGFVVWQTFQNLPQLQDGAGAGAGAGASAVAGGAAPMQALGFSTQEVLLVSVISLATTMLLFTFQRTYATAFYRAHEPRARPEEFAEATDFENESEESAL